MGPEERGRDDSCDKLYSRCTDAVSVGWAQYKETVRTGFKGSQHRWGVHHVIKGGVCNRGNTQLKLEPEVNS